MTALTRGLVWLVGFLLFVGCLGGSMYVSYSNTAVSSWAPFVWGTIAGMLLMNVDVPGPLGNVINAIGAIGGGALLLGAVLGAVWITSMNVPILTWSPFGWSGFLGFLLLGAAGDRVAASQRTRSANDSESRPSAN